MSCSFAWANRKKANPWKKRDFQCFPRTILRSLGVRKKRLLSLVFARKNFRDSLLPGLGLVVHSLVVAVVVVLVDGEMR